MAEEIGRTRMNLSQNSKGLYQADVTAEYPTPEETDRHLRDALDRLQAIVKEKGLRLVEA